MELVWTKIWCAVFFLVILMPIPLKRLLNSLLPQLWSVQNFNWLLLIDILFYWPYFMLVLTTVLDQLPVIVILWLRFNRLIVTSFTSLLVLIILPHILLLLLRLYDCAYCYVLSSWLILCVRHDSIVMSVLTSVLLWWLLCH